MLDENLPTFLLKPSSDKPKQNSTFFYSQYGSDFEPAYSVRHLDPEQHTSRNRYAAAIYDAHNVDVLYAEVLLIPDWTHPTLNVDEVRKNNGISPPPEAILPTEFAIQLYNPDQQITVKYKPATLTTAASWEFEVPQQSFRTPSHSALDRGQDDPTVSEFTPRLSMKWKKDGRLSKDLGCYLSGRSSNPDGTRNKNKEPDVTVAILRNLKELTVYEPNMARVDLEDLKGFEVILLLGAVVIRDVYFGSMKETFNLSGGRKNSKSNSTIPTLSTVPLAAIPSQQTTGAPPATPHRVPPTDPRTQWEIDQETERLRKQAAEEERRFKKRMEEEQRQIKKMLEAEEKEQRKQQAIIDAETQRLISIYGQGGAPMPPNLQAPSPYGGVGTSAYGNNQMQTGPYMTGAASQSSFLHPDQQKLKQKSSIFGFRRHSDQENKLGKKRSANW